MINGGKTLVIYTPRSTILISDVLGSTTHVFQGRLEPEILEGASGDMTNLSQTYLRIGINDATLESPEQMQSWSDRVIGSLKKEVPHFGDLISPGISQAEINTQMTQALRQAWNAGIISLDHLSSTQSITAWITEHNRSIRTNPSNPIKPIVTREGKIPDTQSIITRLGGSQYFSYYRGAITHYLTPYITALLSEKYENAESIYAKVKSEYQASKNIKKFFESFR